MCVKQKVWFETCDPAEVYFYVLWGIFLPEISCNFVASTSQVDREREKVGDRKWVSKKYRDSFVPFFLFLEVEYTHPNGKREWARILRCINHGVGSIGRPFESGQKGPSRMAGIKLDSPGETIAIEEGIFSKETFLNTKKWIKTKDNERLEIEREGNSSCRRWKWTTDSKQKQLVRWSFFFL